MTTEQKLSTEPVHRLLLSFAGPAALSLLVHALYNIVDRFFVGRLIGPDGLAALTLAYPVMIIMIGFTILLGSGAGTLIARYLGENRPDKAEKVLGAMVACFLPLATAGVITGALFSGELLSLLGAEGEMLDMASGYLRIILLSAPFYTAIALEFTIRAEGNPRLPAVIITSAAVLNMILDPVMIAAAGLGIKGAALATIISEGVSALMFYSYYLGKRGRLKLHPRNIRFSRTFFIPLLALGFAPFLMDITSSVQNMLTNGLLLKYEGSGGVAVMGIIFAVSTVFMMLTFGVGDGMIPIISFNLGAGKPERMRSTFKLAVAVVEAVSLLLLLLIELFPHLIAGLFLGKDSPIMPAAVTALRIFALSIPFYSFQIIGSRYLQAVHKPGQSTLSVMLRQLLFFIPAVFLLSSLFGTAGIWAAFPVTDCISALITYLLIRGVDIRLPIKGDSIILKT